MQIDGLTDFWSGFLFGCLASFALALILYSLWNILRGYIDKIQAANKPQIVVHVTNKTPNEVVKSASRAKRNLALILLFLWIIVVFGLEYMRPGAIVDVASLFGW